MDPELWVTRPQPSSQNCARCAVWIKHHLPGSEIIHITGARHRAGTTRLGPSPHDRTSQWTHHFAVRQHDRLYDSWLTDSTGMPAEDYLRQWDFHDALVVTPEAELGADARRRLHEAAAALGISLHLAPAPEPAPSTERSGHPEADIWLPLPPTTAPAKDRDLWLPLRQPQPEPEHEEDVDYDR